MMGRAILALLVCVLGCGDDDSVNCPPDYPVERDGFCYRADDAGEDAFISPDGGGLDAGETDAAVGDTGGGGDDAGTADASADSGADASVDAASDAAADDAGVICVGTHPLLEGERRYCEAGDCFCATPDSCFPAAIAASCCEVDVVCE